MRAAGGRTPSGSERGAALVEFAVLLPLLLLVVMGIVEFGYTLGQHLDVRHGAREAGRMVATDEWNLGVACSRLNLASGATITLQGAGGNVGDEARASIQAPLQTITGFFDSWLPATVQAESRVRIEQIGQPPSWSNGPGVCT